MISQRATKTQLPWHTLHATALSTLRSQDVHSSWCCNVHIQLTDLCNGLIIGDLVVVLSCMVVLIGHSIMYCIYLMRFTLRQSSIHLVFISHLPVWQCNLCNTPFLLFLIPCDLATLSLTVTLRLWLQHCNCDCDCDCNTATVTVTVTATLQLLQLHSWTPLQHDYPSLLQPAYNACNTWHYNQGAPKTLLTPSPTLTSWATSASRHYSLCPPFSYRITYQWPYGNWGFESSLKGDCSRLLMIACWRPQTKHRIEKISLSYQYDHPEGANFPSTLA